MSDRDIAVLRDALSKGRVVWMPDDHTARCVKKIVPHVEEGDDSPCAIFENGEYAVLWNAVLSDFVPVGKFSGKGDDKHETFGSSGIQRREKVRRELGHYGGNPSSDSYNYAMCRAAQTFFPVWDKDKSFAMFDKCCDLHALNEEQRIIVRSCLEKHGFTDKE